MTFLLRRKFDAEHEPTNQSERSEAPPLRQEIALSHHSGMPLCLTHIHDPTRQILDNKGGRPSHWPANIVTALQLRQIHRTRHAGRCELWPVIHARLGRKGREEKRFSLKKTATQTAHSKSSHHLFRFPRKALQVPQPHC